MDDTAALKRLRLLLKEDGALKILLPFHACAPDDALVLDQHIADDPDSELARTCADYAQANGHAAGMPGGYRTPAHYRQVEVKRLTESPEKDGYFTAWADDGWANSKVSGHPLALLSRLTEHERE